MIKVALTLCANLFLAGCVGMPAIPGPSNFERGMESLRDGRIEAAYRFLEDPPLDRKEQVHSLMKSRPEMVVAGIGTFSQSALEESIRTYGRESSFKLERRRLELLRSYATEAEIRGAEINFANAFDAELAAYYRDQAERARVAKLPEAEQNKYWAERYARWQESITLYGRVIGAQLINESQPGTSIGSRFGAIAGQAAYIDSRNIYNYSALGQLQAGVVGAIIGGIADRKPTTSFRKVYFLKSGADTKRLDVVDSNQVLFPVGVCIAYREPFMMDLAPEAKCN